MKIMSEKRDDNGNFIGYETEDGQILSEDIVMEMAREGRASGIRVGVNKNGERVISIISEESVEKSINPMNNFSGNEWMTYSKKTIF
jgi:hypothetical protein